MIVAIAVQEFEEKYAFYKNIYLYCGIAALVFLIVAVLLFFLLKIPQVFGELTGRTARKAVEEMVSDSTEYEKQKKNGGSKKQKNKKKEKRTVQKQVYSDLIGENDTPVRLINHDDIPTPTVLPKNDGKIENKSIEECETDVLWKEPGSIETVILNDNKPENMQWQGSIRNQKEPETAFVVVRSIVEIHTNEIL